MKPIEPLFIHFEDKDISPETVSQQCIPLIRANAHLILGFSEGVVVPDFGEFPQPAHYRDDLHKRITQYQDILRTKGEDPNNVTIGNSHPTEASVMFFYKQQLLYWWCFANSEDMYRLFTQMNRAGKRSLERTYKIPILPIGVNLTYSPELIRNYNEEVYRLLMLSKK